MVWRTRELLLCRLGLRDNRTNLLEPLILLGPLLILLLLLTIGPCVLNRLVTFVRERVSAVQILMLKQQYQGLQRQDNDDYDDTDV